MRLFEFMVFNTWVCLLTGLYGIYRSTNFYVHHVHLNERIPYFFDYSRHGYYIFSLLAFVWLLFEGGIYFLESPQTSMTAR